MLKDEIIKEYGNKVRLRVCGLFIKNNEVLLIGNKLSDDNVIFWSPPGGGIRFGETIIQCLKREFEEETGLKVEVGEFYAIHEHIENPLHAVEIFYTITKIEGEINVGKDPELPSNQQSIIACEYFNLEHIENDDNNTFHPVIFKLKEELDRTKKRQ